MSPYLNPEAGDTLRRKVGWEAAAKAIAAGHELAEAARRAGCTVRHVARRLRGDERFRDMVARFATAIRASRS